MIAAVTTFYVFAQKRVAGGWVRYGIEEDGRGGLRWKAHGGKYTADLFAEEIPGVLVVRSWQSGGDTVRWSEAEWISGVPYPLCMDWIRDRM